MTKPLTNIAASVRTKLLAGAQTRGEDFNLVLQRYAAERFLYRLGASRYRDKFVLKGAMLFALWGGSMYRATRDLDLTGYGQDEIPWLVDAIREICITPCPTDGLTFDPDTVQAEPIRDESDYGGFRVRLSALLDSAQIRLQVDVGFGNAIVPGAQDEEYPTLLNGPPPLIRAYPREAVVAEKLHAMVVLGSATSRLKDFYDLYVLSRLFPFAGDTLTRSIAATFERRKTAIPEALPVALAPAFFAEEDRAVQWRAYLDRNGLPGAPADFSLVGERLRLFLVEPLRALVEQAKFQMSWEPEGPWQ
jgi:hypothetical protein